MVQRVLGHASGVMTMDVYGHLIDQNLWGASEQIGRNGGVLGARPRDFEPRSDAPSRSKPPTTRENG